MYIVSLLWHNLLIINDGGIITMSETNLLLTPYPLSADLNINNRIIMSPMTRAKASDDHIPTAEMAKYYARRADAGLIVTEGTIISLEGGGYPNAPGIYNQKQIEAWEKTSSAVHENQGCIFMQIWHVGRVSHPNYLGGELPISASETVMTGKVRRSQGLYYGKSRAATLDEIQQIIDSYAQATRNAKAAGFDGVEIHAANGYLIDQFLHYSTNQRTDEYGGSPENRVRLALEIVRAVGAEIGFHRVGIRLSPGGYLNEISGDLRDYAVFSLLLTELNNLPIAYVHTGNFDDKITFPELDDLTMTQFMRKYYRGNLIACGGYTFQEAEQHILKNDFDLIAMGRPFIANPDLISKLKNEALIEPYQPSMLEALL